MRLTTVFSLLISLAVPVCFAQTNRITVSGYPVRHDVPISLDDVVRLAIEKNLDLRLQQYVPAILTYDVQSAYGAYYDPSFSVGWKRNDVTSEGAFNPNLGFRTPPTVSQVDTISGGLSGNLPTGMKYQLFTDISENLNNRPIAIFGTNGGVVGFSSFTTNDWNADAGIRVSQPLLRNFWIDSGRLQIKLRKQDRKIAELRVEDVARTIVGDAVKAYYQLIGALDAVRVAEADLAFNRQYYQETGKRVQVGQRAPLDETKAGAEVAKSQTALVDAMSRVGDAEAALKRLISDDYLNQVNARLAPTDKMMLVPTVVDFPASVRTALERRPDVIAAREDVERQNITLKYTFNQLFPSLDVSASWGVTGRDEHIHGAIGDLDRMDFQNDSYGALLTVPLSMWKERNDHRSAQMQKRQLLERLKQTEEKVIADVDDAIRNLTTAYETAGLTREQVMAAEATLDAVKKTYEAGKATSLDVIQAQRDLTTARNKQVQAILDYNVSVSEMERVEGTILEDHKIDFNDVHRRPARP